MADTKMDEFNENASSASSTQDKVSWKEPALTGEEAVCAVCDGLFTPVFDRPPIFCANCKEILNQLINT